MEMKIGLMFKLVSVLVLALVNSSVFAKEIAIPFSAPGGSSPTIDLVFQGELYGPENTYQAIEARIKDGKGLAVEEFLLGFLAASKIPDKEKILGYWEASEQAALGLLMDDPEMWEANKNLFQGIDKSILMATMDMGDYTLAYVAHQYRGSDRLSEKVYPMKKVGDQLLLTNDLQQNSFFIRFSDFFADHLAEEVLQLED